MVTGRARDVLGACVGNKKLVLYYDRERGLPFEHEVHSSQCHIVFLHVRNWPYQVLMLGDRPFPLGSAEILPSSWRVKYDAGDI